MAKDPILPRQKVTCQADRCERDTSKIKHEERALVGLKRNGKHVHKAFMHEKCYNMHSAKPLRDKFDEASTFELREVRYEINPGRQGFSSNKDIMGEIQDQAKDVAEAIMEGDIYWLDQDIKLFIDDFLSKHGIYVHPKVINDVALGLCENRQKMLIGDVSGDTSTDNFKFECLEDIKKFDFVMVVTDDIKACDTVLAQVDEVTKRKDGSMVAEANVIGYRNEKGMLKKLRATISPGSNVYKASQEIVSEYLDLNQEGLNLGVMENDDALDVYLDPDDLLQHIAVIAKTGFGKCLTGDTTVYTLEGTKEIEDLIKENSVSVKTDSKGRKIHEIEGVEVFSIDDDYKSVTNEAVKGFEREVDHYYELETASGRKIKCSEDHPFLESKDREYRKITDLDEGDRIAVPRRTERESDDRPDNVKECEFLGLLVSEGTEMEAGSNGTYRFLFTNNDEGLLQRFRDLSIDLFDVEMLDFSRDNTVYKHSNEVRGKLEKMGYKTCRKSDSKEVPDIVYESSVEGKRRFLRTLFDCEAHVNNTVSSIEYTTASKDLAEGVSYLLSEFGIVSRTGKSWKEATNSDHDGDYYYRVFITGREDMKKFQEEIGFSIDYKSRDLDRWDDGTKSNSNVDVFDIDGEKLRERRKEFGYSQKELAEKIGMQQMIVSKWETEDRRPSRSSLRKLGEELDIDSFGELAESDISWDKVKSIERVEESTKVYDLNVEGDHNFIAGFGGIINHNSYTVGNVIEELLDKGYPVVAIDPHGEYHTLEDENPNLEEDEMEKYGIEPQGFSVKTYTEDTKLNDGEKLKLDGRNLEYESLKGHFDDLTSAQSRELRTAIRELKEKDEDYTLHDLMDRISQSESNSKWILLDKLEIVDNMNIYTSDEDEMLKPDDLVQGGQLTIINLKGTDPELQRTITHLISRELFEEKKYGDLSPFVQIVEEAHNFIPGGKGTSNCAKTLSKIASEGRKFGMGLGVISQRPAKIDSDVLSQCKMQIILRVTNPQDLDSISKSFENVTSQVQNHITGLAEGNAIVLGNEYPLMTDVRTRKSKHGGTGHSFEDQ